MSTIKMIVTDLDRTLLRTDKTISGYTAGVLNRCRERGIKIVFATARPQSLVSQYFDQIVPDALLCSNGAIVYVGNFVKKEHLLPLDRTNELLNELSRSGKTYKISARGRDCYYTNAPNLSAEPCIPHDFMSPITDELMHFSFRSKDEKFALEMIKKYPEFHHFRVTGEDLYDIGMLDATKMNGIKYLSAHFNISTADIAAFGDDYNDIEMLQNCGIGVAVSNALNEAKEVANHVCDSSDEDGVARWLEENVLCGNAVNIRTMTISDYDSVYQLWTNTPGMGLNNLDDSREGIARYLSRNPTTCFVAEDGAEIIGVILAGHDGRRGYIHHTAVKTSERKQGIGTALVNVTLDALRQEGITKVALVVFSKNEIGNTFWEKRGFIPREDLNYRNKTLDENLIRMDT